MLRCFLARGSSCQHHPLTRGTDERHMAIRGLGEIALRANNLDAMQKFYEKVIGLQLMTRVPNCAFFRIADGYGGHTQVLALFDRSQNPNYHGTDAATSTVDHIAFESLSPISQVKRRGWRHSGFKSRPPNMRGYIGARFM